MKKIWKLLAAVAICIMAGSAAPVQAAGGVAVKKKTSQKQPEIDGKAGRRSSARGNTGF